MILQLNTAKTTAGALRVYLLWTRLQEDSFSILESGLVALTILMILGSERQR